MWEKRLYLLIIILGLYIYLMINHPSEILKSLGYNSFLEIYAQTVSAGADCTIIYNPGLRKLDHPVNKIKIDAVLPGTEKDYDNILDHLLADNVGAVVECSDLDSWHTSSKGIKYLHKIREKAYRIVIFDGGHHLATIGLEPDIIIIPQLAGYAVHSYMLDGMKVSKILELAREAGSPSIIATVPRWALVKNKRSLINITEKTLLSCSYSDSPKKPFEPLTERRISKYGEIIFAYINKEYSDNIYLFLKRLNLLGTAGIKKICLAFDYNYTSREEAEIFIKTINKTTRLPVERVNEPVKTTGVFWSDR